MSQDDFPQLRPSRSEIVEVAGDQLVAVVLEGDGVAVPLRLMCEALGIDTEFQVQQLREHPVLSTGLRMVNAVINGRVRSVAALIHTHIPYWLATISPALVNEETRPKLIRYQEEILDILSRLFYGEPATLSLPVPADPAVAAIQQRLDAALREMRLAREVLIEEQRRIREQLGETRQDLTSLTEIVTELQEVVPIAPHQANYIQRAIKRLAQRTAQQRTRLPGYPQSEDNLYQLLFGQFKTHFDIPRYDALPMKKYDQALAWLAAKAAELLPGDPDALPPRQETLL
jgi:P22_AR N-terminal domain/ORF6C domain